MPIIIRVPQLLYLSSSWQLRTVCVYDCFFAYYSIMEIRLEIPLKSDIVFQGLENTPDSRWTNDQLESYSAKSGVYIHHCNSEILYVGKTTAPTGWGTFGERLRRQFGKGASGNSSLYQLLKEKGKPIKSVFFDLEDINMMVDCGNLQLSTERKALILEQALIGVFEPLGNRQ